MAKLSASAESLVGSVGIEIEYDIWSAGFEKFLAAMVADTKAGEAFLLYKKSRDVPESWLIVQSFESLLVDEPIARTVVCNFKVEVGDVQHVFVDMDDPGPD